MKGSLLLFYFVLLALTSFSQTKFEFNGKHFEKSANGTWIDVESGLKIDTQIITIRLKSKKQIESLNSVGSIIRQNSLGYIDIDISKNRDLFENLHTLYKDSNIASIDINTIGTYNGFQLSPNDPELSDQWYLERIQAFDAWDIVTGGTCVTIGVLDSGVDWDHDDLGIGGDTYQNIWLNPGEDIWTNPNNPSTGNGVDDDNDGLIDNWKGWNYFNNTNDVRTTNEHGTRIGGIIAAKTNNGDGIAGVAGGNNGQGVNILPICIGITAPSAAVMDDAILHAVDKGVQVIQISASVGSTTAINDAIQHATDNGVVVVCAAGNDGSSVSFPASNVNTISVGATNQSDQKASFSNYGSNLDLAAPGVDIHSTILNNLYGAADGTSFAAPQVSATVGLMLSVNPSLTPVQIRTLLNSTAAKVGGYSYVGGRSNELGYGRLNTYAAVQAAGPTFSGPDQICTSDTYTISNLPTGATVTGWSATPIGAVALSGSGNSRTVTKSGTFGGVVTLNVTVTGACGSFTVSREIQVGTELPDPPTWTYNLPPGRIRLSTNPVAGATSYQWYLDGNLVGTTTTMTHFDIPISEVSCTTYHYFGVRAVGICGLSAEAYTLVDEEEIPCLSPFAVFPNPADESLTVSAVEGENVAAKSSVTFDVTLYDATGRSRLTATSRDEKAIMDTGALPEGTYFLHIMHGDDIEKRQIVIKHR